jgi:uncharacterized protein involved in type VI secretion and phage assembly
MQPAKIGVMPVNGLLIGQVVKLAPDPQGEHRILVSIPTLNATANTWAQVTAVDEGGAFFRPEIGSEVIVGFIGGDANNAVVLGMLFNRTKPLPLPFEDRNREKGIITRSNLRLYFNDETKTISIDTPAGNHIVLDESGKRLTITDQNANTLTMDGSGIALESVGNITIKAGKNLTITAGASVLLNGKNVAIDTSGVVKLKCGEATLSAKGVTTITGAVVKIN